MMKALPRHRPYESGVGCAEHNDPTCLCDVVLGEPVAILTETRHRFWDMALHELDDDVVSSRNLYDAASIVLGLHKLELMLVNARDQPTTRPIWKQLPPEVLAALKNHARADTPKHIAMQELDGLEFTPAQISQATKAYVSMASIQRYNDRERGVTTHGRRVDPLDAEERIKQRQRDKRAKRTPEQVAADNAKRRERKKIRAGGLPGWLDSHRNGAKVVPDTYALEVQ
jgi:hypothetical protein